MNKQDELLTAMQTEANVDLLYDLWRILKSTPNKAAEVIMQFKDVSASMRLMIADMQESLARFDTLKSRLPDLKDVSATLRESSRDLAGMDDKALNRLNRIIEATQKIQELKTSGALDLIRSIK